jgi:hypothetical protein
MDQDVGTPEPLTDRILELVGGRVGVRKRGALAELDVQIDVPARSRPPGAPLVVADDALSPNSSAAARIKAASSSGRASSTSTRDTAPVGARR